MGVSSQRVAQILVQPTEIDCPNSSASFNDVHIHANSSVIDLYSVGDEDKAWMSLKCHLCIGYGYMGLKVRWLESMCYSMEE